MVLITHVNHSLLKTLLIKNIWNILEYIGTIKYVVILMYTFILSIPAVFTASNSSFSSIFLFKTNAVTICVCIIKVDIYIIVVWFTFIYNLKKKKIVKLGEIIFFIGCVHNLQKKFWYRLFLLRIFFFIIYLFMACSFINDFMRAYLT